MDYLLTLQTRESVVVSDIILSALLFRAMLKIAKRFRKKRRYFLDVYSRVFVQPTAEKIRQSSINAGNKQLWQIRKRETNSEEEGSSKQIHVWLHIYSILDPLRAQEDEMLTGQIRIENLKWEKRAIGKNSHYGHIFIRFYFNLFLTVNVRQSCSRL